MPGLACAASRIAQCLAPSATAVKPADLDISSHAAQVGDLLEPIDEGGTPSVTGADGRAAVQIVFASCESARDACTVRLPAPQRVPESQPVTS